MKFFPLMDEAAGGAAGVVAAGSGVAAPAAAAPVTSAAPVVTAPVTAPAVAAPAHWSQSWLKPDGTVDHTAYDKLPDNIKSLGPTLANAKTVDDVFAKLSHLSTLAGKKALAPLPADAPAEAVAERNALMRAINGVPEKPEGYAITKPADLPDFVWNQKAYDAAALVAHKHNISPAAMKELVATQEGAVREQMKALQQDETNFFLGQDKVFKEALIKDGIPYEKAVDMATRAAKQFGIDPEGTLFKHAEIRLALHRAGLATMEPRAVTGEGSAQPGAQDMGKLALDVIHNKANPDYAAYWNPGDPRNKAVKQQVIAWQAEDARLKKAAGAAKK